jgi:hypothetical protein
MIAWLLGPIGRWFGAAGAVIAGVLTVYLKGRQDASDRMKRLQAEDANRRMQDALKADDSVRRDIAAGGLRRDDGFKRRDD